MKPILSQLLASAQLAEMAYNADQSEHKREAWKKAQTEYDLAEAAEQAGVVLVFSDEKTKAAFTSQDVMANDVAVLTKTLDEIVGVNNELSAENLKLYNENGELKTENSLLKNQLIEKDGKINELEKSLLSAKSTTPATTPAPAPTAPRPLTGAAKVAAEAKAAKAVVATTGETDEAKKNS